MLGPTPHCIEQGLSKNASRRSFISPPQAAQHWSRAMKPEKPQTLGERMLHGAREALAVAKGEHPAAAIWHNGHRYVPERALLDAHQRGRREGMEEAAKECERLLVFADTTSCSDKAIPAA